MFNKEYIICAATYFPTGEVEAHQPINIDSGIVICGRMHHNIFVVARKCGISKDMIPVQGFLSSKDRFLDRKEAAVVAYAAGQIDEEVTELFSEMLYSRV